MSATLIPDLLAVLDRLAGGFHAGFRPAHAKGTMYAGTFEPTPAAAALTRAPHASRPSTPVTVRFSLGSGVPATADNDPKGSGPQGIAVRFHLADHVHTDIIGHSHNGFPVRTGEEFLEFLTAVTDPAGPGAFLAAHPAAKAFAEAPKPIPASFATQAYFAITAFAFLDAAGNRRFGRFRLEPEAAAEHLSADDAARKPADFLAAEMAERLANGPVRFRVVVQLAGPGDAVDDATAVWPDTRERVEFGTVTIARRVDELADEYRRIIFDPVPRVDGIESAGDPLTEVRSDIYLQSGRRRRQG